MIITAEGNQKYPLIISIRADQEINEVKLSNTLNKEIKMIY